jgi:hypothetical protein
VNTVSKLGAAYHRGYMQKDKERGEFYLTILNDLAEDIIIPERITRENLCEVLGWMAREQSHMSDHMTECHDELILLATKTLISRMEKGLFKKGRNKCG